MRLLMPMLIFGLLPVRTLAHSIGAECKQVGERLEVEAFFDDDTPARQAKVLILDANKNVVASAVTDADGKCTLQAPNPGQYQLVVDAGAGHRKQQAITIVGTLPPGSTDGTPSNHPPTGTARREELTRFPWERALVGLGIIALIGGAWWWSRRTVVQAARLHDSDQ